MKTTVLPVSATYDDTQPRQHWLLATAARPVRFVVAGIAAAAVQVSMLGLLIAYHESPEWANAIAVFCGIQASFAFSSFFTWHDQLADGLGAWLRRWVRFMVALSGTALVNEGIFLVLYHWLPILIASVIASSLIALVNYRLGKRFIFSH